MKTRKFLAFFNKQAGFTLIELLVVVAILGMLTVAINAGIIQTIRVGARSSDYVTAIKQVENAMQWLAKDIPQAQTVKLGKESGFPIRLAWTEWDGTTHLISYSISGTDLVRANTVNSTETSQIVVAMYLDVSSAQCRYMDKGSFILPDIGDSFTIYGGIGEDNGLLITNTGSTVVAVTGNATRDADTWTAGEGGAITVTASSLNTRGVWTTTELNGTTCITTDDDNDGTLTGNAVMVQITTRGGETSQSSETRISMFVPRSRI